MGGLVQLEQVSSVVVLVENLPDRGLYKMAHLQIITSVYVMQQK